MEVENRSSLEETVEKYLGLVVLAFNNRSGMSQLLKGERAGQEP